MQELVKLMLGKIEVESKPGNGTCFRLVLPFVPPVADFKEAEVSPAPVFYLQKPPEMPANETEEEETVPLVLIVEDNPDVRFYMAETVRNECRIATVENGAIGIQMAKELVPDIIISDVMMPGKDGFTLCENLKNNEITSHIPIILLTARADSESRIAGLKRGADAYLAKPCEPTVRILAIRLQKCLELLLDRNLTAAEIACRVGFSSPSYFSKAFFEHFGKTPGVWR